MVAQMCHSVLQASLTSPLLLSLLSPACAGVLSTDVGTCACLYSSLTLLFAVSAGVCRHECGG